MGDAITERRWSTHVGAALQAAQTNPGARRAKELQRISMPRRPRNGACPRRCVVFFMSKRLSATDISALASMKNVAKCDTWCELQNPVNHRVFERKLRPKPLGRGHVCLGVTQRCPPKPRLRGGWGADAGLLCATARGWPKCEYSATSAAAIGGFPTLGAMLRARAAHRYSTTPMRRSHDAHNATPGQAGLPAEFKHINKRRKRNLQGFP